MDTKISVILAVYNGEKFLKQQVESILTQTYRNIELVILDDASKDKSFEIVQALAASDARVKVHRNAKNLGVVANFMKGLSCAQGDLVCFSDQDDCWRRDKLEILEALIRRDRQTTLVYSDLEVCDEALECIRPSFWSVARIRPRKGYLKELAVLRNLAPGCSMLFRKEVKDAIIKAPGENPFMHDHLAFVVSGGLGSIDYTPEKLVKYRQHGQNNIGAFNPSVFSKTLFIQGLRRKIDYLKCIQADSFEMDLGSLERFYGCLRDLRSRMRWPVIKYFLFLRNDTAWDKFMGVLECFFPRAYRAAAARMNGEAA